MRHGWMAIALATAATPAATKDVVVGEIAPDAEITTVDGQKLKLGNLRGQVVVLNFWATWCAPCKRELPILDRYYQLRKDAGLRVFAVTTEGSVPLYRLKALFERMTLTPARRIGSPYSFVKAVPTNYIIDRAGRVRYAKAAAFDLDDLNRELIPLLNERAP